MNIVHRAQQLMLSPDSEWRRIDTEADDIPTLYRRYALPLGAVPAVAGLLGFTLVGISILGQTVRLPFFSTLLQAALGYAVGMAAIFLLALLIQAMAPRFGGRPDRLQAFKLAAYSMTPHWVLGIAGLVPMLGALAGIVGGLWSLWVLHRGLGLLMRVPPERHLAFTATLVAILVGLSLALVAVMRVFG
ncbi:Yip1 family protein [Eleftheria terrae]|uniref:Yip1 family protein n=1 Tax=Eleftheria terrae TaxID=1597781 RepID=UPI00263BB3E6|nr:Yip1 family protein [Eleftheria terrae]WKB54874.1 YIP1 family protein [Eleftheria terrae]